VRRACGRAGDTSKSVRSSQSQSALKNLRKFGGPLTICRHSKLSQARQRKRPALRSAARRRLAAAAFAASASAHHRTLAHSLATTTHERQRSQPRTRSQPVLRGSRFFLKTQPVPVPPLGTGGSGGSAVPVPTSQRRMEMDSKRGETMENSKF
jgi:hypothetical protein